MTLRRLALVGLLGWAVFFWTAMLLLGVWAPLELMAAGAIGLAAAAALVLTVSLGGIDHRFRLRWLREAAGVPPRVFVDFGILTLALLRALAGRGVPRGVFVTKPVAAGSAGRRAFLGLAAGYSPNAYVVELDAERGEALVHDLVPSGRSESPA